MLELGPSTISLLRISLYKCPGDRADLFQLVWNAFLLDLDIVVWLLDHAILGIRWMQHHLICTQIDRSDQGAKEQQCHEKQEEGRFSRKRAPKLGWRPSLLVAVVFHGCWSIQSHPFHPAPATSRLPVFQRSDRPFYVGDLVTLNKSGDMGMKDSLVGAVTLRRALEDG